MLCSKAETRYISSEIIAFKYNTKEIFCQFSYQVSEHQQSLEVSTSGGVLYIFFLKKDMIFDSTSQ